MRGLSPDEKARKLLLAHLSPAQRLCFERHGWFECRGSSSGRTYRIRDPRPRWHEYATRNVARLRWGRIVASYCSQPDYKFLLPDADQMLAQKLAIETDEGYFLARANKRDEIDLFPVIVGLGVILAAVIIGLGLAG